MQQRTATCRYNTFPQTKTKNEHGKSKMTKQWTFSVTNAGKTVILTQPAGTKNLMEIPKLIRMIPTPTKPNQPTAESHNIINRSFQIPPNVQ